MFKGSIQKEDIIIVNMYVPNIEACKYRKKIFTDIKRETDRNIIIVGNLTPYVQIIQAQNQWGNACLKMTH